MIELNLLLSLKYGEEKNIPVAWLEIAEQGEQCCRVWVLRLHLHGQNPTSTSLEISVVLSLHSLPSSVGSLQVWELEFVDGSLFSSCWDLLNVFMGSGQSSTLCDQTEQTLLGRSCKMGVAVVALAWKLLSCSWVFLWFVLPLLPVLPPLWFLRAYERGRIILFVI